VLFLLLPESLDPWRGSLKSFAFAGLGLFAILPTALYFGLNKAASVNSQWTDPKTLEFGPSGLIVTGPNYKSELPWSYFKAFSEDASYFYLHLGNVGVDSVIPKTAFSQDLQQQFRQHAQASFAAIT